MLCKFANSKILHSADISKWFKSWIKVLQVLGPDYEFICLAL